MPRIVGVDIPKDKRTEIALTYIYGVGRPLANKVLAEAKINPDTRAKDLSEEEVSKLTNILRGYKTEGDLKRDLSQNIKRLIDIGTYRGLRHRKGLPVRGQRTHTNARTRKGPKRKIAARKREKPFAAKAASPPKP
ncbi:MAG: 30S ribosomal protein S13 [Candidatus Omnitrophica bacterium]|nr:30S ribosomal protein S13 [Candidatus Omnitrophota bacterium]